MLGLSLLSLRKDLGCRLGKGISDVQRLDLSRKTFGLGEPAGLAACHFEESPRRFNDCLFLYAPRKRTSSRTDLKVVTKNTMRRIYVTARCQSGSVWEGGKC